MENNQYYNFYNNLNMSQYFSFLKNTVKLTKIYFSYNIYSFSFNYNPIIKSNKIDLPKYDYKYLKIFRTLSKSLKFYSKEKFEYINILLKNKYLLRDKFKILNRNINLKKRIKKLLNKKNLTEDTDVLTEYINKIAGILVLFYKTIFYEEISVKVIKKNKKVKVYKQEIYKGLISLYILNKILFFSRNIIESLSKKLFSPKKVFLTIGYFSFDNLISPSF